MSKASEWMERKRLADSELREAMEARPSLSIPDIGTVAAVTDGGLSVQYSNFNAREAAILGQWLIDTFGETSK